MGYRWRNCHRKKKERKIKNRIPYLSTHFATLQWTHRGLPIISSIIITRTTIINQIIKFIKYLSGKKSEVKDLTKEVLAEYLPSVSGIKVVKNSDNYYISYEGNGRLVAMQKVFSPSDSINVEVEEYYFKNPVKILRRSALRNEVYRREL